MARKAVIFKLFRQLVFIDTARSAIKLIVMMGCLLPLWSMAQERAGMLVLDQALALVDAGGRGEQVLVQLPYDWDAEHGARAGKAEFEMAFELPGEPSEPHAVFLPRVGNRFEVWLNGVLISRGGQYGAGDARADFGKSPRFVAIPPTLLQKTNLFRVRIEADSGRAAQLGVMLFGPELPVRQAFDRAHADAGD
jgi:hypothetical protein